jgi:hypothetical protein
MMRYQFPSAGVVANLRSLVGKSAAGVFQQQLLVSFSNND